MRETHTGKGSSNREYSNLWHRKNRSGEGCAGRKASFSPIAAAGSWSGPFRRAALRQQPSIKKIEQNLPSSPSPACIQHDSPPPWGQ